MPPTMYEQLKYVREVLVQLMINRHWNGCAGHNLWKPGCHPIRLVVGKDKKEPSLYSIIAKDLSGAHFEFVCAKVGIEYTNAVVMIIKKYLDKGYNLERDARINCLMWRPITVKQQVSIILREVCHDLAIMIGYDVKDYLVKRPILKREINNSVYTYLHPEDTFSWDYNRDVYDTLVRSLCAMHCPGGGWDVGALIAVLSKL